MLLDTFSWRCHLTLFQWMRLRRSYGSAKLFCPNTMYKLQVQSDLVILTKSLLISDLAMGVDKGTVLTHFQYQSRILHTSPYQIIPYNLFLQANSFLKIKNIISRMSFFHLNFNLISNLCSHRHPCRCLKSHLYKM